STGAITTRITGRRATWTAREFTAHLDRLAYGVDVLRFEVESDPLRVRPDGTALRSSARLRERFEVRAADALPWPCADLVAMHRRARRERRRLAGAPHPGRLVLLDGASGSGKTTIARVLTRPGTASNGPALVPRFSTRRPRPGQDDGEYVFVP